MRTHSPACILSFVLTALARGELAEAWAWTDAPEEDARAGRSRRASGASLPVPDAALAATASANANGREDAAEDGGVALTGAGRRARAALEDAEEL